MNLSVRMRASGKRASTSCFRVLHRACHQKGWPRFQANLPTSRDPDLGWIFTPQIAQWRKVPCRCIQPLELEFILDVVKLVTKNSHHPLSHDIGPSRWGHFVQNTIPACVFTGRSVSKVAVPRLDKALSEILKRSIRAKHWPCRSWNQASRCGWKHSSDGALSSFVSFTFLQEEMCSRMFRCTWVFAHMLVEARGHFKWTGHLVFLT